MHFFTNVLNQFSTQMMTRSQAVARIANRPASQQDYVCTVRRFDNLRIR